MLVHSNVVCITLRDCMIKGSKRQQHAPDFQAIYACTYIHMYMSLHFYTYATTCARLPNNSQKKAKKKKINKKFSTEKEVCI